MRDLSWVRRQGQIIEREKRKIRKKVQIPDKDKLDSFVDLYEVFEKRLKDTEYIFREKRYTEKIELQNRIRAINSFHN